MVTQCQFNRSTNTNGQSTAIIFAQIKHTEREIFILCVLDTQTLSHICNLFEFESTAAFTFPVCATPSEHLTHTLIIL